MTVRGDPHAGAPSELVGRDWELATLVKYARAAEAGEGQAVLLRGPAGIGKSKLVATALDELEGLASVTLAASCPEIGAGGYGAVRSLFEPLKLTEGGPEAEELLRGSAKLALPALTPGQVDEQSTGGAYSVMHGLHWLTAGLTARGLVVLAIDDLQWCDEASLRWLAFLLRRAEDLPLLILMTQRTGSAVAAPEVLGEITAQANCRTVDLPPLSVDAVGEWLSWSLDGEPDAAFAGKCTEITAGNPFLLGRVVSRLRAQPEPDVDVLDDLGRAVVVRSVLDRLPEDAHAVALAIAVLGVEETELVAALAGTTLRQTELAVKALRANDMLAEGVVDFGHDLFRQAVLETVSPERLAALRERAATLLNDAGRPAEEIAGQLLRLPGKPLPWMAGVLHDAALSAENRGAPTASSHYLARVLEMTPDDPGVLVQLARVLAESDPPSALEHLERALEIVREPRARLPIAVQYAGTSLTAQNSPRAFALLETVLADFDAEVGERPSGGERALRTLADSLLLMTGMDEKSTIGKTAERFRDLVPPPGETAEERQLLAMLASFGGLLCWPKESVVAQAKRVLRISDVAHGGWSLLGATSALYLADECDPSLDSMDELVQYAQERGEAWRYCVAASIRAMNWYWNGNLVEMLADAQSSYDVVTRERWAAGLTQPQITLATALVHYGEPARAEEILNGIPRPRFDQFAMEYHWFVTAKAKARQAQGDLEGALKLFRHCGESQREAGIVNPVFSPWWFDAAALLAELGRPEEGIEVVEHAESLVAQWETPRSVGMVRAARGLFVPGREGVELLTEAVGILAGSPARLEYARAEYLLGKRLHTEGDVEGARERLRHSIDVSVLNRDRWQVDLSLAALSKAGGRMRRGTSSPADALSGSERRVAVRAAEGATNREIAESLFLTVRTVELHLTSAYRKLGLKGRAELADALAESDPRS